MAMIFDRQRNIVVYDGPEGMLAQLALPEIAKPLYNGYVGVPASLNNLIALKSRGLPAPALIPAHGWPGKHATPFHAQHITANFLVVTPRAFVLSDMGTGKTLSALIAADFVMKATYEPFRWLIVAPLSTLESVWAKEIFMTFMRGRTYRILHGTHEKRRQMLAEKADFYVINHDGLGVGFPKSRGGPLTGFAADLAARTDIRGVIVDEVSAYRDAQTQRHLVARKVTATRPYLWTLTGTPTPNGPTDAYGLAKLVNNAGGESFRGYRDRVMVQLGPFKFVPRVGANEAAKRMLQPAVRFAISDCQDLPPCTTQARDVELTPEQAKAYKALQRDCQVAFGEGKIVTAVNEAVLRMKLLQICCGSIYDANHDSHEVDAKPRLAAVHEIIEQASQKVIVFAPLTNALKLLNRSLKGVNRELVNGETTRLERKRIFDRFCDPADPLKVIIADPMTMAHGLTLTTASIVVWYAPVDKTELYIQANKRIDRPGQTVPTTIVQIASTAPEREIYKRLENNQSLQGVMLKMIEGQMT